MLTDTCSCQEGYHGDLCDQVVEAKGIILWYTSMRIHILFPYVYGGGGGDYLRISHTGSEANLCFKYSLKPIGLLLYFHALSLGYIYSGSPG